MQNSTLESKVRETQRSLFGRRYEGVTLSQIRAADESQAKILEFMRKKCDMLVFCGNPGIGKTFLCACLVEWALVSFPSFRYYNETQLLTKVRESIDKGGDCSRELQNILDDPLIMIDDIGSNKINEWREEIIFSAIDQRYNSRLPTVITSNFSRQEFQENYHSRLQSRLFSKDNIIIEIHNGTDFRR